MFNPLLTEPAIWRMPFLIMQNTLLHDRKSYGGSGTTIAEAEHHLLVFFCLSLQRNRDLLSNLTILAGKLDSCFLKFSKGDSQTSLLWSVIIIIILKHKCLLPQDEWYCVLPCGEARTWPQSSNTLQFLCGNPIHTCEMSKPGQCSLGAGAYREVPSRLSVTELLGGKRLSSEDSPKGQELMWALKKEKR